RVALGAAVSAAFVPGSLLLYALVAILVAIARAVLDRGGRALQGLVSAGIGLALAWVLLLPWSTTWFAPGGVMNRLLGDDTAPLFAASFRGHGMASTLLGQTPDGPPLFGLALPLLGLVAVLVGEGSRRRMALALWSVVVTSGIVVELISTGVLRPIVAAPTEAGVLASLAFAGLAGLAIGAFRLDLRRKALGWQHALTIGVLGISLFLAVTGLGPTTLAGGWDPGRTSGGIEAPVVQQVSSLLDAEAQQIGEFRALWVGDTWLPDEPSALRPPGEHFITGARSSLLTDLFQPATGPGETRLRRVIWSIESGETDRGGRLLGAFNVHFVIVERGPDARGWLAQRDLAVIRTEPTYHVLRNQLELPRAAVFDELPAYARALDEGPGALAEVGEEEVEPVAELRSEGAAGPFRGRAAGPGVVFLAQARHPQWEARAGEERLGRVDSGWGNAFALPAGDATVEVWFASSPLRYVWYGSLVFMWLVVIGAAAPRRARRRRT
ncbi:MAG TPA: hypothetical protein VM638_07295, partial [Actinomycetota bacterium]|nr:hypothetical protein [Actinomycetota bacterium]